jgi:hypothetical protein
MVAQMGVEFATHAKIMNANLFMMHSAEFAAGQAYYVQWGCLGDFLTDRVDSIFEVLIGATIEGASVYIGGEMEVGPKSRVERPVLDPVSQPLVKPDVPIDRGLSRPAPLPVENNASGHFIGDALPRLMLNGAGPRLLDSAGLKALAAQEQSLKGVDKGDHLKNLQRLGSRMGDITRPNVDGVDYLRQAVGKDGKPLRNDRGEPVFIHDQANSTAQKGTLQNLRRIGSDSSSVWATARFETPEQASDLKHVMSRDQAREWGYDSVAAMVQAAQAGDILIGETASLDLKIATGNGIDKNFAKLQADAVRKSNQKKGVPQMDAVMLTQHENGLGKLGAFMGIFGSGSRTSVAERANNRDANFDLAMRSVLTSAQGVKVDPQSGKIDLSGTSDNIKQLAKIYNNYRLGGLTREQFFEAVNSPGLTLSDHDRPIFDALKSVVNIKAKIDKEQAAFSVFKPWTWGATDTDALAKPLLALQRQVSNGPAKDTLAMAAAHLREENPLEGLDANKSEVRNAEITRFRELAGRLGKKILISCKSGTDRTGYIAAQASAEAAVRKSFANDPNAARFFQNPTRYIKEFDAGGSREMGPMINQLRFEYFKALQNHALPNSEASTLINGLKKNDVAYLYLPSAIRIGADGKPISPQDPPQQSEKAHQVYDHVNSKLSAFGQLFLGYDRSSHRGT